MKTYDFIILNVAILIANLFVLGLSVKFYTEYVKDRAQDRRANRRADR